MNAQSRRSAHLLWLIAGWLFIAPLLGFQHLYGAHTYIADDVCETCVLSSGGGQALTPQTTVPPLVVQHDTRLSVSTVAPQSAAPLRANARAPPIA